jgi:hypothetical protein
MRFENVDFFTFSNCNFFRICNAKQLIFCSLFINKIVMSNTFKEH